MHNLFLKHLFIKEINLRDSRCVLCLTVITLVKIKKKCVYNLFGKLNTFEIGQVTKDVEMVQEEPVEEEPKRKRVSEDDNETEKKKAKKEKKEKKEKKVKKEKA